MGTIKPDHWVYRCMARFPCRVIAWNKGQGTASVVFLDGRELEVDLDKLEPMKIGEVVTGQPKVSGAE